jgi:hypothetical protein
MALSLEAGDWGCYPLNLENFEIYIEPADAVTSYGNFKTLLLESSSLAKFPS